MKYLSFLIVVIFISCNRQDNNIDNHEKVTDTINRNSFEYKYKNEPKYFMKFWSGMSKDEFYKTKKQMKKEGLIDLSYERNGAFYDIKIGESLIVFDPILEKEKVVGIKIPDVTEKIYKIFQNKYNLPKLVDITTVGSCYKEENPCYLKRECNNYKLGKDIQNVKLDEVKRNTDFDETIFIKKGVENNSLEIKNEKCNILIRNINEYSGVILLSSNLDNGDYSIYGTYFYYPNGQSSFTSRYRYVVLDRSNTIEISYFPKDYFSKREKSIKNELVKKTKNQKLNKEKQEKFLKNI